LPTFGVAAGPLIVTATSVVVALVTRALAVELLFVRSGSFVEVAADGVCARVVPAAAPAFTFTTMAKVAGLFGASELFVHVSVPVEPVASVGAHDHPPAGVELTNVVFGGTGIVTDTALAVPGPRLVTTVVNVTLLPAATLPALGVVATCRSASLKIATRLVATAELFAAFSSSVLDVTDAVSAIRVPDAVPAFTVATIVKVAVPAAASVDAVQVKLPPTTAPQLHPAGGVTLWKVVFVGTVSDNTSPAASLGPLFVITCV
jgi:hypothetical protein